jgi:hypothetical protein
MDEYDVTFTTAKQLIFKQQIKKIYERNECII